jgi:molybdopterin molybdotransferase
MISVAAAKKIITENIPAASVTTLPLGLAAGMALATDIFSSVDIPAFPQSSMDGYAFYFQDWTPGTALRINGEVPAGRSDEVALSAREAVRIFTGAAVPAGADTVVMQEKVEAVNGELLITDERLVAGSNVRPKGSEIKKGALALPAGSILSPAAIGFLSGIGVTTVSVHAKPVVSIIVTGKELQQPGQPLSYGQVYESNSFTLTAALQQLGIWEIKVYPADDDLEILTSVLNSALDQSNMVLLTGGISVGDYDFVLEASTRCGIEKLFHKIKQRPGKPIYVGKKGDKLVFGLPGNPSSVLTCFYEYVSPALQQYSKRPPAIKQLRVPLRKAYEKAAGLTHFLKGWYDGLHAMPLDAQESYKLSSFAKANCLIQLEEEDTIYKEGDLVEIHLIPF